MSPLITVYIPSYNYGKYLEQAIESVLRQSMDDWELLIINDNSTDNTADVMKLYESDKRIRLFTTNGKRLPGVCNLALEESQGELIIRLDADDFLDENILLVLSNFLKRHMDHVMVFPDYYLIDEFGKIILQERRERLHDNNHLYDIPANGACSLIRKKVLLELGGYREDLGMQDGFDIWNRLIGKYKIANINLPLFYYRRHGNNLTNDIKQIFNARRRIKFDEISERLETVRPIIALIPCRKHYDFSEDLWKRKVHGKSLLERDIAKCIRSSLFDKIVVAADTEEVQSVMELFDSSRLCFFKRQTENTIRSKSLISTLEEIYQKFDPQLTGITVLSYLQAPFVQTETLEEAVYTLILNNVNSSLGVFEINDKLFKRSPYGLQAINPSEGGLISDFDTIYKEASTSLALRNMNTKNGSMKGPQVVHYTVSSDEMFFIDSEQNLKIAEILLKGKEVE